MMLLTSQVNERYSLKRCDNAYFAAYQVLLMYDIACVSVGCMCVEKCCTGAASY